MNLINGFDPLLWDIFIDRLENDSKSMFHGQSRLEIITFLKSNLNQFTIDENDVIYLNNVEVFSENHKNQDAIDAFKLLTLDNYGTIEDS